MSEPEITAVPSEPDSTAPPPKLESESGVEDPKETTNSSKSVFSIWPPSKRTRDAVIKRLIETLSNPSVLSKRYGTIPHEEASDAARLIEEQAYSHAASLTNSEDDGIEILQVYSREISKLTLETVKARPASASQTVSPPVDLTTTTATTTNEEISSLETESS